MNYRKGENPLKTIDKIKNVLTHNNIQTKTTDLFDNTFCVSCRIELSSLPGVGSNGKGINTDLALASAYGELMERLESGYILNNLYSAMPVKQSSRLITIQESEDFQKNYYSHLSNFLPLYSFGKFSNAGVCMNIITDKRCVFPLSIIEYINGSNGMCSGNTYEEAVTQGICEIFERFVLKEIYFNGKNVMITSIPRTRYIDLPVGQSVRYLEERGYNVTVLDCTLGGVLPVVGIILCDTNNKRYKLSLGSDIDFNIAIQRCLTEILQGLRLEKDFRFSMQPFLDVDFGRDIYQLPNNCNAFTNALSDWSGPIPAYLFNIVESKNKVLSPFYETTDMSKALSIVTSIAVRQDKQILVQDNSTLGFPAYRIIIPGMSDIRNNLRKAEEIFAQHKNLVEAFTQYHYKQKFDAIVIAIKRLIRLEGDIDLNDIYHLPYQMVRSKKLSEYLVWAYFKLGRFEDCIATLILLKSTKKYDWNFKILNSIFYYMQNEWSMEQIDCILPEDIKASEFVESWCKIIEASIPSCPNCDICQYQLSCTYYEKEELSVLINSKAVL